LQASGNHAEQTTIKFNKMKKIFTLIFSLGLLTAAFAQDGHHDRNYNSSIVSGNQSWYQGDQKNNDHHYQAAPYSKSDSWNYQSTNERRDKYGYGNEVDSRHDLEGKDDMRGNDRQFDDRRFSKGMNKHHSETYRRKSRLQISFDFGHDHK